MADTVGEKTGNPTAIGTINFENYKVISIINAINDIINIFVSNVDRKEKLKRSVRHYRKAIYTDDKLNYFDDKVQNFFQLLVELHGEKGVTNYIHTLGSGYMIAYMQEWKNLNRYSKQG